MKDNAIIWITGASSGIGESLAKSYDEKGWQVIASSRDLLALQSVFQHHPDIVCLPCDVSDEASVNNVASEIKQKFGYLSHVVVNAGNCEYVDEMPIDMAMFDRLWVVNVKGAVHTVNAALPLLQAFKLRYDLNALVIAINSQVIFAPFTRSELYGATKAAFDYLMRSWRLDLANYHIDVSVIYPGFVDTPLTRKNNFAMPFLQTPDQASKCIQKAIDKRVRQCVFPKRLYALLLISRLLPKFWEKLMLRGQYAAMRHIP